MEMFLMSNDTMCTLHNQAKTLLNSYHQNFSIFAIYSIYVDIIYSISKENFETAELELHLKILMLLQKLSIPIVPSVIVGKAWKIYI